MSQSFDYHTQPTVSETRLQAALSRYWKEAALINTLTLHRIIFKIQEGYNPNNKSAPWKDVRDRVLKEFFPFHDDHSIRKAYASVLGSYFSRGRRRVKKMPSDKKVSPKKDGLPISSKKKTLARMSTHIEPNGQRAWDL